MSPASFLQLEGTKKTVIQRPFVTQTPPSNWTPTSLALSSFVPKEAIVMTPKSDVITPQDMSTTSKPKEPHPTFAKEPNPHFKLVSNT